MYEVNICQNDENPILPRTIRISLWKVFDDGKHIETLSAGSSLLQNIRHLSNETKPKICVRFDKLSHTIHIVSGLHFNCNIFLFYGRNSPRKFGFILCFLIDIQFHRLFCHKFLENVEYFAINWQIWWIYSEK